MAGFNKLKSFFIEEEQEELTYEEMMKELGHTATEYEPHPISVEETPSIEIDIVEVSSIEEIYAKANMDDLNSSIYKVEEIRSVLPTTLSNSAKKESVLGMMQVSKIDIEEVIEDAKLRQAVLEGALKSFTNETIDIVESNTASIIELEEAINNLKEEMNQRQLSQEQQEQIVNNESNKIDSIIKFIS